MRVTIITVVYNGVKYIKDTIESVISQTYKDIEYIVIDGGSSDGTREVIEKYKTKIAKIISEKDAGHIHAMNKGLALAAGDIIGFLHSDDFYAGPEVIEKVVQCFETEKTDSVFGDIVYVNPDDTNRVIRFWKSGDFKRDKIKCGWMPPHPGFFVRKQVYDKYGGFDTEYKIAVDYEIILRFLYKYKISAFYLPVCITKMRWGGISNRNFSNILKKTKEDIKACRQYGLGIGTIFMKNLVKVPQFLRFHHK